MSKHEFMARLYNALASLSTQERDDILNDYEEHFRIGREMGKSEAEIVDSLGSPEELAASFTEDGAPPPPQAEEAPPAPEEYGDNWSGEQNPFDQNAPQYQDYYNPDEYGAPPPYGPPPEAAYGQPYPPQQPYPQRRGAGETTALTILMICLTVFIVVPAGIPLFFAFFAVIILLAFAAGWLGISVLIMYGTTAAWLIAGIALLCLCACLLLCVVTYTVGGCRLAAKYVRFFGRVVSGRKEPVK